VEACAGNFHDTRLEISSKEYKPRGPHDVRPEPGVPSLLTRVLLPSKLLEPTCGENGAAHVFRRAGKHLNRLNCWCSILEPRENMSET
jgi:hypothetical protein